MIQTEINHEIIKQKIVAELKIGGRSPGELNIAISPDNQPDLWAALAQLREEGTVEPQLSPRLIYVLANDIF